MIELLLVGTPHDEFGRRAGPDRGILAGLAVPGRVLFSDVPARLMLKPIVCARQHRALLVPDYLLVV